MQTLSGWNDIIISRSVYDLFSDYWSLRFHALASVGAFFNLWRNGNMKKKFFAICLIISIIVSCIPFNVYATNSSQICLADLGYVDWGRYTGNLGDSCVFNLDKNGLPGLHNKYYNYGNIGVDGTIYNNGFEVWIARWNFGDNISWAYKTIDIGGEYSKLSGKTGLIKSKNTTDFDTTAYFYDGDTLLYSVRLTPDDWKHDFEIDVTGVKELKVMVKDNEKKAGGTSFALYNLFLERDTYDPYYVTLSPHRNWFIPDYEMPLIPKTKTSEYASELYEWAKEFDYDDIITEEASKEIVKKYMPTTYRVNGEYVRDNMYETKSVMRDIIMINSTKKSIYNWENKFLVPNSSTKVTNINKRAMKILEGYADYCDSADRNPVTNALYTVATTAYTKGSQYIKGKLKSTGYNTLDEYLSRVDSVGGLAFDVPTKFWNDVKLTYNTYRYDSLSFNNSAWKKIGLDMTKSIVKSEINAFVADALSLNDTTAQMHALYTKLRSLGGHIGDGLSSAIAPYKLAYELIEYTVEAGQDVNKAFVFLTQYHFINRYPELCGIMFDKNGKICRDVVTLNMEILPRLDDNDYIGKALLNRLLEIDGLKDSVIFSVDDKINFAMMQSAVTMNLIDGLNVNALRKDLVEYWAYVYSGAPVTKTNVYVPSGSSCTVSASLSVNENVATLDETGEFKTTSENVSVKGRADDAIIVEVIGDYNIQVNNATDDILISEITENAGDITNNTASLYEKNTTMSISTAGDRTIVTSTDNSGEQKIEDPIAVLDDAANKLLADADALTIIYEAGDSDDNVKGDLILSEKGGYGSTISWKSSDTNVITDSGGVIRGDTDQIVTMTATLTLNSQEISKSFVVIVRSEGYLTITDTSTPYTHNDTKSATVMMVSDSIEDISIFDMLYMTDGNEVREATLTDVLATKVTGPVEVGFLIKNIPFANVGNFEAKLGNSRSIEVN